ncbi:MAG: acetoacetate decarboxylase family protein [Dehalococcoidia bacterium]
MTKKLKLPSSCFSQPYGPAQLYGPPPYLYRDARSITAVYTAHGTGITEFLPPGVELADPEPLVLTTVSHYPHTAFGAYNEFWIYVRAIFGGERFMYCVLMYADSESATAAGRELWGFPKKWAGMSLRQEADQWIFRAERPAGHRLLEVTLVEESSDEPMMLKEVSLPALSLRLIPNYTGQGEPDVAQLLATNNKKSVYVNALGGLERRQGRAHVAMYPTAADPIGPFIPKKMLGGWFFNYDTDAPAPYALIHDYKNG